MEILLYIAGAIALLALAGLFVFLIFFLNGTKGLLNGVTVALKDLVGEITALRGSLQGTIGKLNDSVGRINAQLDQVEGIIGSVREMTNDVARLTSDATDVVHDAKNIVVSVIGFVDNVQAQVQKPITEVATIFSALGAGIRKFRRKLGGHEPQTAHTLEQSVSGERHVTSGI
ncbi:MAG: hypothetical protein JWQ98_1242 [Chlorobi bacterium]|nr:hypothetical protein [Chlorobiota bacterium]